ncbi:hypothetical protein MTR67_012609 [Solanum verrucosum]|uniref:Uncharacterized protein n=1 Tax=Solanum verrucosum TaxID=315347 RepID=A0AAF0THM8_SOLVR|nr:hypothetical protein MTR67_012609 [Solanum verrucosum]
MDILEARQAVGPEAKPSGGPRIRQPHIYLFGIKTPTMAMFLPRFSGNDNYDPKNWIFRAELYFTYLGFFKEWLPLPLFYLDDVLGSLDNSSEVHSDYINSSHVVSQSAVESPFCAPSHFLKSSTIASSYDARSSKAGHVFDKLPVKYQYVESGE